MTDTELKIKEAGMFYEMELEGVKQMNNKKAHPPPD